MAIAIFDEARGAALMDKVEEVPFDLFNRQEREGAPRPTLEKLVADLRAFQPLMDAFLDSFTGSAPDRSVLDAQRETVALAKDALAALILAERTPGVAELDARAVLAGNAMIEAFQAAADTPVESIEGAMQVLTVATAVYGIRMRMSLELEGGAMAAEPLGQAFEDIFDDAEAARIEAVSLVRSSFTPVNVTFAAGRSPYDDATGLPRIEAWDLDLIWDAASPLVASPIPLINREAGTFVVRYDAAGNAVSTEAEARRKILDTLPELVAFEHLGAALTVLAPLDLRAGFRFEFPIGSDLRGGAGDDLLTGGIGNDFLFGGGGDDTLRGNSEDDALRGGAGDDRLFGGGGRDTLEGGAGADTLDGGGRGDTYILRDPDDVIEEAEGRGDDEVRTHVDYAVGGQSIERIAGQGLEGLTLTGSAIDQEITGTPGDDRIDGGGGRDLLSGKDGADSFVFTASTARAEIADFVSGTDRIVLDAALLRRDAGGAERPLTSAEARALLADGRADWDAADGTLALRDAAERVDVAILLGPDAELRLSDLWLI